MNCPKNYPKNCPKNLPMDTSRAYDILGIHEDDKTDITIELVKRQYKKKALQYHPDKNRTADAQQMASSVQMFREVAEAYQYLVKQESWDNCDLNGVGDQWPSDISSDDLRDILRREFADIFNTDSNDPSNTEQSPYINILLSFLGNVVGKDVFSNVQSKIFYMIIHKICVSCEPKVLDIMKKLDPLIIQKIYGILETNQSVFHFSETFLSSIQDIIKTKSQSHNTSKDEQIILYTFLDDLFANNLYKLHILGKQYIIPLWHHELVYDISGGGDLYVQCVPLLPDNMSIDENNNLHIQLQYPISDLLETDENSVTIFGNKTVKFRSQDLKIKKEQSWTICGQGIPKINPTQIYDISKKGDIILHVNIVK